MPIQINVKCSPASVYADEIRGLLCRESATPNPSGRNPLTETNFNELLELITQTAFDEGRRFAVNYPNIKP